MEREIQKINNSFRHTRRGEKKNVDKGDEKSGGGGGGGGGFT